MPVRKVLINYIKRPKYDVFITPKKAVYPLLNFIPDGVRTIWECADCGESGIRDVMVENGYKVISTCEDFLTFTPDFHFDAIVTNPPFSLKTQFLERCYQFQKFFALLMPLTALEGISRGKLYRKYGINVLVLDKRINFMVNKNRVWFPVSWFFWYPKSDNNQLYFYQFKEV